MKSTVSSEKLIQLVKQRPTIWNKRASTYLDKVQREESWTEIAQEWAGEDWYGMSDDEQRNFITSLKNRWKNLRDTFHKITQKNCQRKYYYADMMNFLLESDCFSTRGSRDPVNLLAKRKTNFERREEDPLASEESNSETGSKRYKMTTPDDVEVSPVVKIERWPTEIPDDFGEESASSNMFEPNAAAEHQDAHQTTELFETIVGPQAASIGGREPRNNQTVGRPELERHQALRKNRILQNGPDDFEKEILKILKTSVENSRTTPAASSTSTSTSTPTDTKAILPDDPDAMFLLSQLPYIKSLNFKDRMDFRIKFLQFLQSFLGEVESRNTSNTNN